MRFSGISLTSILCGFALVGCSLGPGMHMDEDGISRRVNASGAADPKQPPVIPITPDLLSHQREERAARERGAKLQDPLAELARTWQYRVAPFDVLSVTVWDHPELTIPAGEFRAPEISGQTVNADGTFFYPHVGVVKVAGLTLPEVRTVLTDRLGRVIERPQLDVKVASFRGYRVNVTGEVSAPAALPITDVPLRALDALNMAKPTVEADLRRVTLTRAGTTHILDLQATNELGDLSQNWLLQDGDILHVPDRSRNKVFVLGEVRRPSSRLMVKGRMTLADAIGDSEGFDPVTSNPGKVYVVRGAFEQPSVFRLDASSPDALLLAVQFQLQPGDVVYVSAFELTRWNRIIAQLLPTVQLLWQSYDLGSRVAPTSSPN